MTPTRRVLLQRAAAWGAVTALPCARATPESMQTAVRALTGGRTPREGRVAIDIAPLVENGNVVPVTVSVDAPVGQVRRIGIFTERNPLPEVVQFELGPRIAKPVVSTRMRLATSQQVLAVALMADGSSWSQRVEVVVTLAACVEG